MTATSPRRLNLVDGMILMAGVAGCFLLTRLYLETFLDPFLATVESRGKYVGRYPNDLTERLVRLGWFGGEACKVATLWLGMLGPIVLLLRLRPPRPDRAELMKQPGAVATVAATAVTGLGVILWVGAALLLRTELGLFFYRTEFADFLGRSGLVVAVAWLVLILGGRWAPEASTLDRAGRCIGAGWIIICLMLATIDFAFTLTSDPSDLKRYSTGSLYHRL